MLQPAIHNHNDNRTVLVLNVIARPTEDTYVRATLPELVAESERVLVTQASSEIVSGGGYTRPLSWYITTLGRIVQRYESASMSAIRSLFPGRERIAQVLVDAVPHIEDEFGVGTRICIDFENDEGVERLFVNIRVDMTVEEARTHLKNFHRNWWNSVRDTVPGKLYFDIEFI